MPIYRPGQGVPLARVTEERQPTIILSIPASPPAAGISTTNDRMTTGCIRMIRNQLAPLAFPKNKSAHTRYAPSR